MNEPTWEESSPVREGKKQDQAIANQMQAPKWEDSEEFGLTDQLKAAAEGAARGTTLGGSDLALTSLGLVTPEALSARREQFPVTSALSNIGGGAAALGLTGGLTGILGKGATFAAKTAAMAGEGALFGAGNAVTDYALGDPELNAQKVMAHIGTGAALGGGLAALAKGVEVILPEAIRKTGQLARAIKGSGEEAASVAPEVNLSGPVADAPYTGVKPTSFQDLADKVKNAKYTGESLELPGKQYLSDAASRVEMMNPVHPLQLDSLGDQMARDSYNIFKESSGPEGDALRGYESLQKNELNARTNNEIELIAPGHAPVSDAIKGGDHAIESFTEQYQKEKADLGKVFEEFKKTPLEFEGSALTNAINHMTDAVPGVARMFDIASEDGVKILPYKSSWGIDKATYRAVKEAVSSLKENPEDFESIQNIRNGLKQHVDVLSQGQAPQQIRALGKAMMDFMQEAVEKSLPDSNVRDIFKRYAQNEQERQVIEKAFGASVGSQEFGAISKIKPEMIGDKIFSNSATVDAAKKILEPKRFNELLANWLAENKARVTDKGVFSSNKWNTFLSKNQDALNVAFKDNPGALQRLKDYTTIMRMLPDAPSINPSGTAKTLMGMLKNIHGAGDVYAIATNFLKNKTIGKIQEQIALSNLNEQLAGRAAKATVLSEIKSMAEKTSNKISSGAKSIFNNNGVRGGVTGAAVKMLDNHYEKNAKKIQNYASNPQELMNHLASNSSALYDYAPNVTQGIHNQLIKSVDFLYSKLPKPNNELPLAQKWEPTKSQKSQFNRYYEAVNDPISALAQIKNGSLSNETMEALTATQPHLLEEMQKKVLENINPKTSMHLNYATKISLSKFLQQPLDEGMMPQVLAANQASYAMPPQRQNDGAVKTSQAGMKNMDFSGRARTASYRDDKKA